MQNTVLSNGENKVKHKTLLLWSTYKLLGKIKDFHGERQRMGGREQEGRQGDRKEGIRNVLHLLQDIIHW